MKLLNLDYYILKNSPFEDYVPRNRNNFRLALAVLAISFFLLLVRLFIYLMLNPILGLLVALFVRSAWYIWTESEYMTGKKP